MKDILVLTDFSHPSLLAVRAGADMVRRNGGHLHILHVFEKPLSGIALQIEVDNQALRQLHIHMEEAMEHVLGMEWLRGIDVTSYLLSDEPVWEVINQSPYSDFDLIVAGAHGQTSSDRFLTGSVTKKIMQYAEKPVLVVKHRFQIEANSTVVFASDFSSEAIPAFAPIAAFADFIDAEIHLLKVITPTHFERSSETEACMADFATKTGLTNYSTHVFNDMSIEGGVEAYCKTHGASMVAMETHGRTGLSHLLYGSTAEDVLAGIELPMLSTHITQSEPQTH